MFEDIDPAVVASLAHERPFDPPRLLPSPAVLRRFKERACAFSTEVAFNIGSVLGPVFGKTGETAETTVDSE